MKPGQADDQHGKNVRPGNDGRRGDHDKPRRGRPCWRQSCHDGQVPDDMPPPDTRRDRLWTAAEARNIPLRAILATVAVVVVAYMAGKLIYRLRDILLLMIVAGFVAVLLNPLVLAVQRWGVRRRGLAVAIVTLWALLVFAGLAIAFGYPLANGVGHLANDLPSYVSQVQHGKGWLGHLVRRYHVQAWVQSNAPKLTNLGQGLAKPALTLGKGAISLVIALLTIFVLVLLLLLEGPKMRTGLVGMMSPARAERYSRVAHEVTRSVTGYMLGNFLTSLTAGIVVFITLLLLGVPFPFLWALWVALVDSADDRRRPGGHPRRAVRGRALARRASSRWSCSSPTRRSRITCSTRW
jgi:hypothetical protein